MGGHNGNFCWQCTLLIFMKIAVIVVADPITVLGGGGASPEWCHNPSHFFMKMKNSSFLSPKFHASF